VARYHLARRCVECTTALNAVRAVTRYAAQPRKELVKAEPSALGLAVLELERLRAEARALRRVYLPAPPLDLVRANEARQIAARARVAELLAAFEAERPVLLRSRSLSRASLVPGWDLRW
jgi:hypothetical protein